MLSEFEGRVAVVTGAGSGIGAALVRACANRGMFVVGADVSQVRVESVVSSLSDPELARAVTVDVSDPVSVDRLADETYEAFGATHLLCNNAGVSPLGRLWEFTPGDWNSLLGVNFVGVA